MSFLDHFIKQLDSNRVDYTYDDDIGDGSIIVIVYSKSDLPVSIYSGYQFTSDGDLMELSFGLDMKDTEFSVSRKEAES